MRIRTVYLIFMATTGLVGGGTLLGQQPNEQEDLKKMQGVWRVVKMDNGEGADPQKDELKGLRVIIRGNKFEFRQGKGKAGETVFSLDPKKKPKWINIQTEVKKSKVVDGKVEEVTVRKENAPGIYEIKGDTLRLCFSSTKERPKEFSASVREKRIVLVLEREKNGK